MTIQFPRAAAAHIAASLLLLALLNGGVSRAASAAANDRLLNKVDQIQRHIERVTEHVVLKLNQPAAPKPARAAGAAKAGQSAAQTAGSAPGAAKK